MRRSRNSRRFWTAGATLVATCFGQSLVLGVAAGADLDLAPPPFVETWSGFYAGIHGGVGAFTGMAMDWDFDAFSDPGGDFDLNGFAGLLGGQIGYNHQIGNIVYGLEGDIAWTDFSEEKVFDNNGSYVKAEMDWLATVRGRLGLAAGNAMVYATGGLAIAQLDHCANDDAPCSIDNDDNIAWDGVKLGLVAGAGVETRLSERLSLKGEYLFVQMDRENIVYDTDSDDDIDFSNRAHLLRIGLNYHFNGLPLAEPIEVGGSWSGFYAGIHGGVGAFTGMATDWDRDIFADPDGDIDLNGFAGLAGGQVGYNHRVGNIVYGVEGDIAWTDFSEEKVFDDTEYVKAEMDWLATVRGRLGLAAGNAMAYVTGGLAIAQLDHCANDDEEEPCSIDNDENTAWDGVKLGLVAGAGVETRLSERLSLKGEYLFVQMDKENIVYDTDADEDIDFSNHAHLLRIGLNYHFNGLPLVEPVEAGGPWSGFYAGIHGGVGAFTGMAMDWDYDVLDDPDGDIDLNGFAGLAGGQVGYNYQVGNIVYGLEGDMAWTGFSKERAFDALYAKAEMDWLATARGRMGLTVRNAMAYVTGGLAIAQLDHCANGDDLEPCSIDNDQSTAWDGVKLGLVAGAGVETRLNEKWSLKGEYLFVQMDKENVIYDTNRSDDIDFSNRAHLFRIGLNYSFGR